MGSPNDRIGAAGVIDGLSPEAHAYFAAGGLGISIGDGALNYRPEKIVESYYSYSLNTWSALTFDYQFVADPAYDADRGPAIFSPGGTTPSFEPRTSAVPGSRASSKLADECLDDPAFSDHAMPALTQQSVEFMTQSL